MSRNVPFETTVMASPSASRIVLFADTDGIYKQQNQAGFRRGFPITNFSTASQAPAVTRTYIVGSNIAVPVGKLQIGTMFEWVFDATKTAASTAAAVIDICVGTAGTTADTARVSFTLQAQTAATDTGRFVVEATVRGPLTGSGVMAGVLTLDHIGGTAGLSSRAQEVLSVQSAGFDVTVANLIVGLCCTTGTSAAWTFQRVKAEAWNL